MNSNIFLLLVKSFSTILLIDYVYANLEGESIIGGNVAKPGQFKYQASIQLDEQHLCGGAIVSKRHVLTAAHCFLNNEDVFLKYDYTVVVGVINAMVNTRSAIRMRIEAVFVSAEFSIINPVPSDTLYRESADLAVVKLDGELELSDKTGLTQLELPTPTGGTYSMYVNEKPVVVGFGCDSVTVKKDSRTNKRTDIVTDSTFQLKFATTIVYSNEICSMRFVRRILPAHLCAQVKQRSGDYPEGVCSGDSGNPLVLNHNIIIGILSTGPAECNETKRPAIYTRITSYLAFIHNAMQDKKVNGIRRFSLKNKK